MIKLFAGTNCADLSQEISNILKIKISKSEIIRFDNSELRVRILDDVKNTTAIVIQSGSNPTDRSYMELFFFADALKNSGAKKIIAVIPYFGYARQDVQHRKGECVSANLIIKFIGIAGYNNVIVCNIHEEKTLNNFSIPIIHISAIELLAKKMREYFKNKNLTPDRFIVVTPDQAGLKRAEKFSQIFFSKKNIDVAIIEKKRDLNKIHASQAVNLIGNVNNKTAIIIDDIVTSGNTLINAANMLLKNGAENVFAAIVHHDFSPLAHKKIQDSCIERFFTTNTIKLDDDQRIDKLDEISIASAVTSEILKLI